MSFTDTKRKKPRFYVNLDALYFYDNGWDSCFIYDINLEGAGLTSNQNFQNNELIKLKLVYKTDEIIINSSIVYSKNFKTGLVFPNITDDAVLFIKKLINYKTERFKI